MSMDISTLRYAISNENYIKVKLEMKTLHVHCISFQFGAKNESIMNVRHNIIKMLCAKRT